MRFGVSLPGPFYLSTRMFPRGARRRRSGEHGVAFAFAWLIWQMMVLCLWTGLLVIIVAGWLIALAVHHYRNRPAARPADRVSLEKPH